MSVGWVLMQADDADLLVLDLRGHLEFGFPDEQSDLFGGSRFDSLFDFDGLPGIPQ